MRREADAMVGGFRKRVVIAVVLAVALVGPAGCDSAGDDSIAEVGSGRSPSVSKATYSDTPDDASDDSSGAADSSDGGDGSKDSSDVESGVGEFEEADAATGPGVFADDIAELADQVTCAPVDDGTDTVPVGPKWTPELAYDVTVFEGPSDPTENRFSVAVLDPGFSAATLEWTHLGAVVEGETDDSDQLPTVAYFVSPEGQIDGLANTDEVREQAIAINADLADEVSEEAAEAGRAMIEGLPDEALIALYASREVFFHSLDGFELTEGSPLEFATAQPDAGGFGLEVPATIMTQIETMANDAGCVVVTQTTEPNRDELEQLLDQGTAAGQDYNAETLPTFSNTLTAWVDGTTGEVRHMSRQETRSEGDKETLMTTFDLFALDAE